MLIRIALICGLVAILVTALVYSQFRQQPFRVSGFIEADEIRPGSRVGGRVKVVHVAEGQAVEAGAVLLELEPYDLLEQRAQAQAELAARQAEGEKLAAGHRPEEIAQARARRDQLQARLEELLAGPRRQEIAAAQAQVELAEAQANLARLTFDRTKQAFDRGAATQDEMDRAASELAVGQARLAAARQELAKLQEGTRPEQIAQARAQLAEAEEALRLSEAGFRREEIEQARAAAQAARAAVEAIERRIEELSIRCPVDAAVEAIDLRPGDLVAPNAPVVSLMDRSRLWVRAYVPENRLDVRVGQKVSVTVDSYPGQRFAGHVSFLARQAEFTPSNIQTPEQRVKQVFRIKVALDEGLDKLRPGMAADVWLDEGAAGAVKARPIRDQ